MSSKRQTKRKQRKGTATNAAGFGGEAYSQLGYKGVAANVAGY